MQKAEETRKLSAEERKQREEQDRIAKAEEAEKAEQARQDLASQAATWWKSMNEKYIAVKSTPAIARLMTSARANEKTQQG